MGLKGDTKSVNKEERMMKKGRDIADGKSNKCNVINKVSSHHDRCLPLISSGYNSNQFSRSICLGNLLGLIFTILRENRNPST